MFNSACYSKVKQNMDEESNNQRIEYWDVAKGLGIICVMLGHLGCNQIDRVVFTFHMPLFFLISGWFLKTEESLQEFVKKKTRRLLIPYYVTGCIICICLFLADIIRGMKETVLWDMTDMLIAIFYASCQPVSNHIKGIGAVWFFWALFWAMIIVKLFIKYKWCGIIIAILAIVAYISSQIIWLPLSVQPGICASIFVYLGIKFKQLNLKFNNRRFVIACGIIMAIEICFGIRVDMAKNRYDLGIISVIGSVCICYVIVCVAKVMVCFLPKLKRIIAFMGKSFFIYVVLSPN